MSNQPQNFLNYELLLPRTSQTEQGLGFCLGQSPLAFLEVSRQVLFPDLPHPGLATKFPDGTVFDVSDGSLRHF